MQFLVYLTVLMVSISTVLLELHWLTSPPPQSKPAIQAASSAPPPKVEGPSAALSPVYPRKIETVETAANAPQPPAVQSQAPQPPTQPVQSQAQQPQTKPQAETTGMATREDSVPPAPAPRPGAQQASAALPEASTSNNRCDVQACAGAFRSFRASDCTYQPFDGGERRLCAKGPATARSAARDLNSEPAAVRRSVRDYSESRDRETDRRARALRDDDDDDAVAAGDGERGGPLLFLFGGQRRRW